MRRRIVNHLFFGAILEVFFMAPCTFRVCERHSLNSSAGPKPIAPRQVHYHVRLCAQAGLVTMGREPFVKELTWQGHELLQSFRDHDPTAAA